MDEGDTADGARTVEGADTADGTRTVEGADAADGARVFVYGTLTEPERTAAVLDDFEYRRPAVLEGLHRVDGEYPTLAPGGSVEGRVLATDALDALDRYEGVGEGLYVRVSVPFAAGGDGVADDGRAGVPDGTDRTVEVYVGDPDRLDALVEWPGDGPFPARVRAYLADHAVVVRPRDASGPEEPG